MTTEDPAGAAAVGLHEALGRFSIVATVRAHDPDKIQVEMRPGSAEALTALLTLVGVNAAEIETAALRLTQQLGRRGLKLSDQALIRLTAYVITGRWHANVTGS